MKLYSFEIGGSRRIGAAMRGQLVDLSIAYAAMISMRTPSAGALKALPADMLAFIRMGEPALAAARHALAFMARRPALPVGERATYVFDEVKLAAPLPRPGKILCASNAGDDPAWFVKLPSTVIGSSQAIVCPPAVSQLAVHTHLAAVIGKRMKGTPESGVSGSIFGYTILNDIMAAELLEQQPVLARNFDTFCPLGPCIATADDVADPAALRLRTVVNGQLVGESAAPLLLQRIASLATAMTLEPGDVVSIACETEPPLALKTGDTLRTEIESLGALDNPVAAPSAMAQIE